MTVYEWRWWVRWDMIPEMARRELCKPDANTVSICSLYTIEKRFSGNRESCHFWFRSREFAAKRELRSLFRPARGFFGGGGRKNQGFLLCFCLLRAPRGTFLEVAVEHFFIFLCFCSTFSSVRHDFGLRGRTFFLFFLFLFYFQLRADRFSWRHASQGYRSARQMMLWNPRP